MFIRVDKEYLVKYSKNDYLLPIISAEKEKLDRDIIETRSHQFKNMIRHQWKRAIFHTLYSDLVGKKILDIGGGYCGYSPLLELNDYTLLDIEKVFSKLKIRVFTELWEKFIIDEDYDVIICCDVFITNSFALDKFLEKYLPMCKELRLTITFHSEKGTRGWTLEKLNNLLHKYGIEQLMEYKRVDYLPGGRNVYILFLKGGKI